MRVRFTVFAVTDQRLFFSVMESTHWAACYCFTIAFFLMTSLLTVADGDIILSGSESNSCRGTVEFNNGTKGRVCSDNWDLNDAEVVCRQLKCGKAVGAGASPFGSGTGTFLLSNVACSGSEARLTSCGHRETQTCNQGDAGVVCSKGIPTPRISVSREGEVTWGDSITITCYMTNRIHQLVQGSFILNKNSVANENKRGTSPATFSFSEVTFEDEGQYQCLYVSRQSVMSPSSSSVKLDVNVWLQPPNISASSPDGGQQWAFDRIQVTKGHSFVINCSTSDRSPEGLFFLLSSASNMNTTQTSVNHSASFHFPVADYEHQGNYSCVYEVTGPSRKFTSPLSLAISVTVKWPLLPVVLPVVAVSLVLLLLLSLYLFRRRQRVFKLTASAQMTERNEYKDSDEEEEADYVNVSPGRELDQDCEGSKESVDEPDYVNVTESLDVNTYIYGGGDSIYQNY